MKDSGRTLQNIKTIKGKELLGLKYSAPFDDLGLVKQAREEKIPILFYTVVDGSEIVVSTEGTGLYTLPRVQEKRILIFPKKEKLSIISLISDDASYRDGMGEFSGRNAKNTGINN